MDHDGQIGGTELPGRQQSRMDEEAEEEEGRVIAEVEARSCDVLALLRRPESAP